MSVQNLPAPVLLLASLFSLACGTGGAGAARTEHAQNPCLAASDHVAACAGEDAPAPAQACTEEMEAAANDILELSCEDLDAAQGKSDTVTNALLCRLGLSWFVECVAPIPLSEAAKLPTMDAVCGAVGSDPELCTLLSQSPSGDDAYGAGMDRIADRLSSEDRVAVVRDPSVRVALRDRLMERLVDAASHGEAGGNTPASADAFVREHFPLYASDRPFSTAVPSELPAPASCEVDDVILFFPGGVRLPQRDEFAEQRTALEEALPCTRTFLVDGGTLVDNGQNARAAADLIARIDAELDQPTLHMVGYSQGTPSILATLATYPDVAARTATVLSVNGAPGGTALADLAMHIVRAARGAVGYCENTTGLLKAPCEAALNQPTAPSDFLTELVATAMGITPATVLEYIDAEGNLVSAATVRELLVSRAAGLESITNGNMAAFWDEHSGHLPDHTLFLTFRSVVTDEPLNLPSNNRLMFEALKQADPELPYNDMTVSLRDQQFDARLANQEVLLPIAEGNHWQWPLATGVVPEAILPASMTDRIPHLALMLGAYGTLWEAGFLAPAHPPHE